MKQVKTSAKKNRDTDVKDIGVNTQVSPGDIGRIRDTAPNEPVSDEEVEETTILVNPDEDSMESRG